MRSKNIFIILLLLALTNACVPAVRLDDDLITTSYLAADILRGQAVTPIPPGDTVLVGSFVNIDNLEPSTLGRTVSEMIASRFTQTGYKVIEMKLRKSVFIRNKAGGEFMLSREVKDLTTEHNAHAVIAGTYAVGTDLIYVKASIVDPATNIVMSSYDYKLPITPNIRKMLGSGVKEFLH
ncbi:MAG: hypothetical protein EPN22_02930 [Nitrospirae bacterium]|nr:MAG: hypothetical protein EPN22_02930 [Nitrospirota bacterium]